MTGFRRQRTFDWDDQIAFARLSGDSNPLHVDRLAARRTPFGGPLVHGLHAVLWVLDAWCEAAADAIELGALRALFRQPIRVGDCVTISRTESNPASAALAVDGREVLRLDSSFAPVDGSQSLFDAGVPLQRESTPPLECADLSFEEAAVVSGVLPLTLDRELLARLFPALARWFPPVQVAELLAATRLVGMVCPGKQSTLAELDLRRRADGTGALELSHRVLRAEARYSAIHLAVAGPTLAGQIKTLFRPAPQSQPGAAQLKPLVTAGEFADQRALVIGGSRGLGEVTAKLLAAGGADVVISYRAGEEDARRVSGDIVAAGGRCQPIEVDCAAPGPLADWLAARFTPTHLYYFATPAIVPGRPRVFSHELFVRYCQVYAEGLFATVNAVPPGPGRRLMVFYPSTVYLDEHPPNLAEYCAAKAAGEALCRYLAAQSEGVRCHVARLPRLRTDQTLGFVGRPAPEPQDALLRELRQMARAEV